MSVSPSSGVSVIICCFNSARRLPDTLRALAAQTFRQPLNWELIVVDNASTDDTALAAPQHWQALGTPAPMRVVAEPNPGLAHARNRGIEEASFGYLLFCDDDNWLCPAYVEGVYQILTNHKQVAACGGRGLPLFETTEPSWFETYQEAYAVGAQTVTNENGKLLNLYGAGMAISKEALRQLYIKGFKPCMLGRVGKKLSSSEDTELTNAFVLIGYNLFYAPHLSFQHYLPGQRLTRPYLKKLYTAFGTDGPVRNLYYAALSNRPIHKRISNWNVHVLLSLYRLVKYAIKPPKKAGRWLFLCWNLAYIRELLALKKKHAQLWHNIEQLRRSGHHTPPAQHLKPYVNLSSEWS